VSVSMAAVVMPGAVAEAPVTPIQTSDAVGASAKHPREAPSELTPGGQPDTEFGPAPKRLRLEREGALERESLPPATASVTPPAAVPAPAPTADSTAASEVVRLEPPTYHGKRVEVLWNVHLEGRDQWVWWGCKASFAGKRDKRSRCIYTLIYDERLDLGFQGQEERRAVFTAHVRGVLKDLEGRGHTMQYRHDGDSTEAFPHPKATVIVQTANDEKEWLGGTVVAIDEDGLYTVQVGTGAREKSVAPDRVVEVHQPPGLPKEMLIKATSRFIDRAISAATGLPVIATVKDMRQPARAHKLVFDRIRSQKDRLTDVLLGMVGVHDDIEGYDSAIAELDHDAFCATHIKALAEQAVADADAEMKAVAILETTTEPQTNTDTAAAAPASDVSAAAAQAAEAPTATAGAPSTVATAETERAVAASSPRPQQPAPAAVVSQECTS